MKYVLCVFSPARKKFKTDILLRVEVPKSTSMMVTENFNEVALQLIFANLFCYQYLHIPRVNSYRTFLIIEDLQILLVEQQHRASPDKLLIYKYSTFYKISDSLYHRYALQRKSY